MGSSHKWKHSNRSKNSWKSYLKPFLEILPVFGAIPLIFLPIGALTTDEGMHISNGLFYINVLLHLHAFLHDPIGYVKTYYALYPSISPLYYQPLAEFLHGLTYAIGGIYLARFLSFLAGVTLLIAVRRFWKKDIIPVILSPLFLFLSVIVKMDIFVALLSILTIAAVRKNRLGLASLLAVLLIYTRAFVSIPIFTYVLYVTWKARKYTYTILTTLLVAPMLIFLLWVTFFLHTPNIGGTFLERLVMVPLACVLALPAVGITKPQKNDEYALGVLGLLFLVISPITNTPAALARYVFPYALLLYIGGCQVINPRHVVTIQLLLTPFFIHLYPPSIDLQHMPLPNEGPVFIYAGPTSQMIVLRLMERNIPSIRYRPCVFDPMDCNGLRTFIREQCIRYAIVNKTYPMASCLMSGGIVVWEGNIFALVQYPSRKTCKEICNYRCEWQPPLKICQKI